MSDTLQRIEKTLHLPIDILLLGETGTGKEVIAQYIHTNSNRKNRPYIIQNCAAIPEQLLESELFGHKKGSFTGANKDQIGLFEAAQGLSLLYPSNLKMLVSAR